ncbi:MAG: hypothetical protein ACLRFE_01180 [Clostridia bacterium]
MSLKKILNVFIVVFFIAFSCVFCFARFNNTPLINGNNKNLTLYEIWHIESFEGGGANRQNYLNKLALSYEKLNPSILFMVKNIDYTQLDEALNIKTPHIISFSEQVAKIVLPHLKAFDTEYNIQNNYLESSTYNGKLMAIPFIASGYCYFTKTSSNDNLNLYTSNNNLHSASHLIKNTTINNGETLSSYQCYSKFVNTNNTKLLGTARDLYRLKNLESLGRFSVKYEPVSSFTDLIQYLGKTSNDNEVNKFIDFVMNKDNQMNLSKLSLFNTTQLPLYTEPTYAQMENVLKLCHVPNIFI